MIKKVKTWKEAKKKYRLSEATVQIAIKLGLNPHKLGKIAHYKQEPWKELLSDFIRTFYEKKLKRVS